jgi:cytosine/uracil/thiamine/allantoin permease
LQGEVQHLFNYAWFVGFAVALFAYGGFMTVAGKLKPVTTR